MDQNYNFNDMHGKIDHELKITDVNILVNYISDLKNKINNYELFIHKLLISRNYPKERKQYKINCSCKKEHKITDYDILSYCDSCCLSLCPMDVNYFFCQEQKTHKNLCSNCMHFCEHCDKWFCKKCIHENFPDWLLTGCISKNENGNNIYHCIWDDNYDYQKWCPIDAVYGNICPFHCANTNELIINAVQKLPIELIKICIEYFYDTKDPQIAF